MAGSPAKPLTGPPTKHQAFIYDRGGNERLFRVKHPTQIQYDRRRDDQSKASVQISASGRRAQAVDLESIEPGRHELVIFREGKLAWVGPMNLPTFENGTCSLSANDITMYLDRTAPHAGYDNRAAKTDYVVNRLQKMFTAELARKEALGYNLLEHIHYYVQSGDAKTTTNTAAYALTLFDHLDELAARSGIDYTVVGRELHIWDTSRGAMGQTPVVGREDFLSEPTVKKHGAELATRVIATDGQGGFGIAGGTDPYYGEWEIVVQAYDEQTDTSKPTAQELQSQANLSLKGRNPTPMQLAIPQGSGLSPKSKITPDLLVPGVYVPLRLRMPSGRFVTQMQKLQQMQVTDSADGEKVTVSLYPAAGYGSDDAATVEGDE